MRFVATAAGLVLLASGLGTARAEVDLPLLVDQECVSPIAPTYNNGTVFTQTLLPARPVIGAVAIDAWVGPSGGHLIEVSLEQGGETIARWSGPFEWTASWYGWVHLPIQSATTTLGLPFLVVEVGTPLMVLVTTTEFYHWNRCGRNFIPGEGTDNYPSGEGDPCNGNPAVRCDYTFRIYSARVAV